MDDDCHKEVYSPFERELNRVGNTVNYAVAFYCPLHLLIGTCSFIDPWSPRIALSGLIRHRLKQCSSQTQLEQRIDAKIEKHDRDHKNVIGRKRTAPNSK